MAAAVPRGEGLRARRQASTASLRVSFLAMRKGGRGESQGMGGRKRWGERTVQPRRLPGRIQSHDDDAVLASLKEALRITRVREDVYCLVVDCNIHTFREVLAMKRGGNARTSQTSDAFTRGCVVRDAGGRKWRVSPRGCPHGLKLGSYEGFW